MAADKSDDPGVLGNLPRSRPGHRSDKRAAGGAGRAKPAAEAATSGGTTARAKATAGAPSGRAKTTAAGKRRAASSTAARQRKPAARPSEPAPERQARVPEPAPERTPRPSGDPLTGAVRLAGKVAEAGLKTAGDLLRRLPGR
ncbi:MAG: hypothetical protein QOF55_1022 [Thermoleophilaceae bacterium]|nr:hypothetical protein [Thermoleophilaceae bacterium]